MNTKRIDLASQTADHCELDAGGHCITCMDEALPARVVKVDATQMLAQVEIGDACAEVDISLVDGVKAGEWLLIHGGVALERVPDASGAQRAPREQIERIQALV